MSDDARVDGFEWRPGGDAGHGAPPRSSLAAILPSGRVLWLGVGPAPATASSLREVVLLADASARRHRRALQRQRAGIVVLARLSASAGRHVSRRLVAGRRQLRRRVRKRALRLDLRLAKARETLQKKRARTIRVERESIRRLERRDLWDKAVLVTALPLFAAYGEKGRPFGTASLALLLSTLLWLVGDEVVDAIFGPEEPTPYAVNDLDVWSYIAPVANLFGGYWLLDDFQHERFVSGFAKIPPDAFFPPPKGPSDVLYEHAVAVDMSRVIGSAHFPTFASLAEVPAVATIRSLRFSSDPALGTPESLGVTAQVIRGTLVIFFHATAKETRSDPADPLPPVLQSLEVAWMVDTAPTAAEGR